jgi:energy-coupling factor transporter ATP-binding protein EcfA2
MDDPRLLLLDEPVLVWLRRSSRRLYETLQRLHRVGLTLLLAEQSIPTALEIADYAYVLQTVRTVLEGSADALRRDRKCSASISPLAMSRGPKWLNRRDISQPRDDVRRLQARSSAVNPHSANSGAGCRSRA